MGKYAVTQGFQPRQPLLVCIPVYVGNFLPARLAPVGVIQPLGSPISHSAKGRATVCFSDGRFSRPVNPYTKPIRQAPRLEELCHVSLLKLALADKRAMSVRPHRTGSGSSRNTFIFRGPWAAFLRRSAGRANAPPASLLPPQDRLRVAHI